MSLVTTIFQSLGNFTHSHSFNRNVNSPYSHMYIFLHKNLPKSTETHKATSLLNYFIGWSKSNLQAVCAHFSSYSETTLILTQLVTSESAHQRMILRSFLILVLHLSPSICHVTSKICIIAIPSSTPTALQQCRSAPALLYQCLNFSPAPTLVLVVVSTILPVCYSATQRWLYSYPA